MTIFSGNRRKVTLGVKGGAIGAGNGQLPVWSGPEAEPSAHV
jgi:hypothetical protein